MYYPAGDHVYYEFYDINGKVILATEDVCFGGFYNSNRWNSQSNPNLIANTTLLVVKFKHKLAPSRIAYFEEQMAQFGMYDNVKLTYDKHWIYLSMNPQLTTAQEMFFVGTVHRLICFFPDVAKSFYKIHKITNFRADLLLLLCHWIRFGKGGDRENMCSDHTLLGGYGQGNVTGSFKEVLRMVRTYPKLPVSRSYQLYIQTYHSLFRKDGTSVLNTVEFIDVNQLESLCV
jgi:hypothetical protein